MFFGGNRSPFDDGCSHVVDALLLHCDADFVVKTLLHSDFGGITLCDACFAIECTIEHRLGDVVVVIVKLKLNNICAIAFVYFISGQKICHEGVALVVGCKTLCYLHLLDC